jgi:hypothetical protein
MSSYDELARDLKQRSMLLVVNPEEHLGDESIRG